MIGPYLPSSMTCTTIWYMRDMPVPVCGRGRQLTAARAVRVLSLLRATPGREIMVYGATDAVSNRDLRSARKAFGPNVLLRTGDDGAVWARARVAGEPARPISRRGMDTDLTGKWLTIGAAARAIGMQHAWFRYRYVKSGLITMHKYGQDNYVLKEDVDRIVSLLPASRRLTATTIARMTPTIPADDGFDPDHPDMDDTYFLERAIKAAKQGQSE